LPVGDLYDGVVFAPELEEDADSRRRAGLSMRDDVDLVIDPLRPEDWPQVRQIYLDGLATGNASFEVEAPSWERWDEPHHPHSRLVARRDGAVVGWAALAPVSQRQCYAGVAEVSLYVAADQRGQGVGKRLLQALIESSERHGIWSLYGATFPENTASVRLQL